MLGSSPHEVAAAWQCLGEPLAPSLHPAPSLRPGATCLSAWVALPEAMGAPGTPGPPSTDAGVTPLIGAPPPRGPASIFHGVLLTSQKARAS